MEKTFKFTVELTKEVYTMLLKESKIREGSKGAVPSRTARQLIEERLEELAADKPTPPMPTRLPEEHGIAEGDLSDKPKSKKPRSRKRDVGEDESTPTV